MPGDLVGVPDPDEDKGMSESVYMKWLEEAPRAARLSHRTLVVFSILVMGLFISPPLVSGRNQTLLNALRDLSDGLGEVARSASENHYPSVRWSRNVTAAPKKSAPNSGPSRNTPQSKIKELKGKPWLPTYLKSALSSSGRPDHFLICMAHGSDYSDINDFSKQMLRKSQPVTELISTLSDTRIFSIPQSDVDKAVFDQLVIARKAWSDFLRDEWNGSNRPRNQEPKGSGSIFIIRLTADCSQDFVGLEVSYELQHNQVCQMKRERSDCEAAIVRFQENNAALFRWAETDNIVEFALYELPNAPQLRGSARIIKGWSRFQDIAELPLDAAAERVKADLEEQNSAWSQRERSIMGVSVSTPTPWFVTLVLVGMCIHVVVHLVSLTRITLSAHREDLSIGLFPWIGTIPGRGVGVSFFLVTFLLPMAASLSIRISTIVQGHNESVLNGHSQVTDFDSYWDVVIRSSGPMRLFGVDFWCVTLAALFAAAAGVMLRGALRNPQWMTKKAPRWLVSGWSSPRDMG
ncbi:hypothetical protein ACNOYE_07335 [Nannocystaceae bacterium ST9]